MQDPVVRKAGNPEVAQNRIGAVIYDFDGTLVNSLSVVVAATNAVLVAHGKPARPAPEVIAGMVHPTGQRVGGLLGIDDPAIQADLAGAFYHAAHRLCEGNAFVYSGIAAAMAEVAGLGLPQGVLSNNQGTLVRRLLDHLDLAHHVAVAFGEEDVPAPKPDPRGVRLAAERLGHAPSTCVYVGDTPGDLHTAHAAGMRCIGVSWGITPRAVLARENFSALIDHPRELASVVAKL
jgi:phosphoglycolate phosphatase